MRLQASPPPYVVFTAVFMAMLILPLIFVDLSANRVSIQENRMLAERPRLEEVKNNPVTFIRNFDGWFKDSTGFRAQLISLYGALVENNRMNGVRYTDGQNVYLRGEQGHHYFAYEDGWMISKFQGKQFLSDEELQIMATTLEKVDVYLNKKKIPFILMFCTDKESVYPEFYPKSIKRGKEPIQLDIITEYIRRKTNVDVFNIRAALIAEKGNFLLYNAPFTDLGRTKISRRDIRGYDLAHYNQIGAFFAYRELMKHITQYLPQIIPYELSDIDISYTNKNIPLVSFKEEKVYDPIDKQQLLPYIHVAYQNRKREGPTILIFGDSYIEEQFIMKYIAQHFGETIFVLGPTLSFLDELVTKYTPDIVVFETAERGLKAFASFFEGDPKLP